MLTSLGGIGAVLNGIIENFGTILIIVFFADLVYTLKKKHKFDYRVFQTNKISKMIPNLIEAAKLMDEQDKTMKKMPKADDENPKWLNMYLENNANKDHQFYITKMEKFYEFYLAEQ